VRRNSLSARRRPRRWNARQKNGSPSYEKSAADAENQGLAPNIGWPARFLFLAYMSWLITLARQAIKVQPTTAGEEILPQKAVPIQNHPSP
jgi:hypothetical protein